MKAKGKREAVKLTTLQLEALRRLSEPGARAHYMPYAGRFNPNAYWFISPGMKKATKQVKALLDLGLLDRKITNPYDYRGTATINAKGRRLLKSRSHP